MKKISRRGFLGGFASTIAGMVAQQLAKGKPEPLPELPDDQVIVVDDEIYEDEERFLLSREWGKIGQAISDGFAEGFAEGKAAGTAILTDGKWRACDFSIEIEDPILPEAAVLANGVMVDDEIFHVGFEPGTIWISESEKECPDCGNAFGHAHDAGELIPPPWLEDDRKICDREWVHVGDCTDPDGWIIGTAPTIDSRIELELSDIPAGFLLYWPDDLVPDGWKRMEHASGDSALPLIEKLPLTKERKLGNIARSISNDFDIA